MGASGSTTVDFGTGKAHVSVAVSAASILAGSLTEAWLFPKSTANHNALEHVAMSQRFRVVACAPTAGVGFDVHVMWVSDVYPEAAIQDLPKGLWTIAWVWN